ncbi:MAG TPA: hypothetical protein VJL27_03225, partial [Patescibacteria group bacterium]|nr:hypothetical protein [Patescibacteria group bacterium]
MGIFGTLERTTDLQSKLEAGGVTEKMVRASLSDAEILGRVAIAFGVESTTGWLDRLVQAEKAVHCAFFGRTFDLSQFRSTLERYGEDRVKKWAELGLEPHYLPEWTFSPDAKVRGWKVRPEPWFWEQLAAGNIKRRNAAGELETITAVGFDGATLLIDTRCNPVYDNGRQMFL